MLGIMGGMKKVKIRKTKGFRVDNSLGDSAFLVFSVGELEEE